MTTVYGKDKHFKWHYGRLGGYLEDEKKQVYGITCQHVTKSAHNGSVYIKDQNDEYIEFGKTVNTCKTYEIMEDIGLILINDYMLHSCDITIRNSNNVISSFDIYDGPAGMLFEKSVFMRCLSSNAPTPKIVSCRIASANVHFMLKEYIDVDKVFLVESSKQLKPGESGNLFFMENSNGTLVYILGILLGGKLFEGGNEFVLCLRFDYGKDLLEHLMEKTLSLPKSSNSQCIAANQGVKNFILQVGFSIWVKVPEDVAKSDFVLFDHLMMLIDCFSCKQFSPIHVKLENTFEAKLSEFVNSRNEKLESINCETIDQRCFLECMIGCKHLYSGHFEKSDEHLKDAVRLISKTSCRNRLLCKLVTYSTWQLLELEQLDNMKDLLKEGEVYMLKMNECNACPLKSIGYHYFDYARYYKRIQDNNSAMLMARKSLEYFELDEKYRGRPSHGKCFALSMIARLNLQCGDRYETRHMTVLNLDEAQECISDMNCFGNDLPAVEKTSYYLVKTDFLYRRGEMEKAKISALKCFRLAQQNDLKKEQEESEIRIRELTLLCYQSGK